MKHDAMIVTHPSDNVGVAAAVGGLKAGTVIGEDLEIGQDVPMGHKVALADLEAGQPVIRYGHVIGFARANVRKGDWIREGNLAIPEPPRLDQIAYRQAPAEPLPPLEEHTFEGYRNADGTAGTKNVLAITTSVQCVAGVAEHVERRIREELLPRYPNVDDVMAFNHGYGCGVAIDVPAASIPIRTISNLARNPNFGGEVMVLGLGCEKLRPERLVSGQQAGQSVLYLQDEKLGGFAGMVEGIMRVAETHLKALNARQRTTCPASDLVVGMQCGGSDAFSGLTGNPVAGFASDLVVRAGGTVFFSEVTEVRDAAEQLVARAASEDVADALKREIGWYDDYLRANEADRAANTTPGNKAGGLSNIVEKALGSVAKSGSSPIVDVVSYGGRVRRKGLNFVATPASDFVCGTLQLAAGMNMHLFITGRGTPYGLRAVPVIKISSNSALASRWHDLIDFDAGPVASGLKSIEELGWELFRLILDVASGNQAVAADKLGLFNDLVLFNPGPLT